MVRAVVLYGEEPDPERYAEHVELCGTCPGDLPPRPALRGRRWASRRTVLRRMGVRRQGRLQGRRALTASSWRPGKDALAIGRPSTVEFVELVSASEPRRALLAHRGDALADVRPGHVEELERERRVERRARGAQPVVERELRVADRRLRAGGEPPRDRRARAPRAPPPARRARRARSAPPRRRRSARTAAGGTSPSPSRRAAATRSRRGRRRPRRASCGRRRCAPSASRSRCRRAGRRRARRRRRGRSSPRRSASGSRRRCRRGRAPRGRRAGASRSRSRSRATRSRSPPALNAPSAPRTITARVSSSLADRRPDGRKLAVHRRADRVQPSRRRAASAGAPAARGRSNSRLGKAAVEIHRADSDRS